jgi:hypothetical protein
MLRAARSAHAPTADERAATGSDVAVGLLVAVPFVDAFASMASGHVDRHVALELAITDLEAFSVTEALTFASKRAFARQRPDAQEAGCDRGDGTAATASAAPCARADRNASFWSGHTSFAFTSASLMCTEHLHLALYGPPFDVLACVASLTAASTTGALRIVADRHWASDVVFGAAVGTLSGWLVPTWLRFRSPRAAEAESGSVVVLPVVAPIEGGATFGVAGLGW